MRKRNDDIRHSINNENLMMHEVAEFLGVSESTFYRWLRTELTDERKQQILDAINKAKREFANVQ